MTPEQERRLIAATMLAYRARGLDHSTAVLKIQTDAARERSLQVYSDYTQTLGKLTTGGQD